jgi:hypothetical protein
MSQRPDINPIRVHLNGKGSERIATELNESLFSVAISTMIKKMGFELSLEKPLEVKDFEYVLEVAHRFNFGTPDHEVTLPEFLGRDETVTAFVIFGIAELVYQQDPSSSFYQENKDLIETMLDDVENSLAAKQHIKRFINQTSVLRGILDLPIEINSMSQVAANYLQELSDAFINGEFPELLESGDFDLFATQVAYALPAGSGKVEVISTPDSNAETTLIPAGKQESGVSTQLNLGVMVGAIWAFISDESAEAVLRTSNRDWNGSHSPSAQQQVDDYTNREILGG